MADGVPLPQGAWPQRAVTTLDAVGAASLGSIAVLVAAGVAAAFGLFLLIAALWPGRPKHVAFFPTISRADSTSPF